MGARVIRPGIAVVAQPMPGHPLAASNCYLIATDDGAIVVDPGYDRPDTLDRLGAGLAAIDRDLDDIRFVALTHSHRDHAEAADVVRRRTGAAVGLHPAESGGSSADRPPVGRDSPVPEAWAVPEGVRERLLARRRPSTPRADVDLEPGWKVATTSGLLRVLHTPGHTAGSVCLVLDDVRLILTGDHVLPGIHPGAGLGGRFPGNPLLLYRQSLHGMDAFAAYDAHPGHGGRMPSAHMPPVHVRAREIAAHHERRTRDVADELSHRPGLTVWELALRIRWSGGFDALDDGRQLSALRQTAWHRQIVREGGPPLWNG